MSDRENSEGGPDGDDEAGTSITRRQAIAGGGVAVLLGTGLGVSHLIRPATAVSPTVPEDDLAENGWVRSDRTTETVLEDAAGPVAIEAIAGTVQYDNEALHNDITDTDMTVEYRGETTTVPLGDSLGSAFDQSMGVFAATKIDVTPHVDELPGGLGRKEVMEPVETRAQEQFEAQLRENGLEDVRQVGADTLEVATGETATVFEYRATFVIESTEVDLDVTSIDVDGGEIAVAGYLAIWHSGKNAIIAAGGHPDENYTETVTDTVLGEELSMSFDLGLSPGSLEEEILGYMRRVE